LLNESVVCFETCGNSIQGRLEAADQALGLVAVRQRAIVRDSLERMPLRIHEAICWDALEDLGVLDGRGILRSSKGLGNRHALGRSHVVLTRLDRMRSNVGEGLHATNRMHVARGSRIELLSGTLRSLIRSNTRHLLARGKSCLCSPGSLEPFDLSSSFIGLERESAT